MANVPWLGYLRTPKGDGALSLGLAKCANLLDRSLQVTAKVDGMGERGKTESRKISKSQSAQVHKSTSP